MIRAVSFFSYWILVFVIFESNCNKLYNNFFVIIVFVDIKPSKRGKMIKLKASKEKLS